MAPVYLLTLRQLSGRWRLGIMAVLAALPVLMGWLAVAQERTGSMVEFEAVVFAGMLAGSIGPLVVLAIGGAAFANEVEDKTIANIFLAPIPRWQLMVPKLLAVMTVAAPFMMISAGISAWIAYLGDTRAILAAVGSALTVVALYGAFFVWLGLVSTQAIGIGLLYIVVWEGFFSGFVTGVRVLSLKHYSTSMMHLLDARRFAESDNLGSVATIIVAIVVFAGFTLLGIRRLKRMDIP